MKTMTCADLGGLCEQKLSAETWNEMVEVMTKHVKENHPETAEEMEETHNKDPKKWSDEMEPKWEETAED